MVRYFRERPYAGCTRLPKSQHSTDCPNTASVDEIAILQRAARRLTVRDIVLKVGLGTVSDQDIIITRPDMRQVSAHWLSHVLNIQQKQQRVADSNDLA